MPVRASGSQGVLLGALLGSYDPGLELPEALALSVMDRGFFAQAGLRGEASPPMFSSTASAILRNYYGAAKPHATADSLVAARILEWDPSQLGSHR